MVIALFLLFFFRVYSCEVPYDAIINLGGDCQVAYQMHVNGLRKYALPFDSLITPFDALYKLLDKKFEQFLEKENLEFEAKDKEKFIVDKNYDVRLMHDFGLDEDFLTDYNEIKAKYERRTKRFLDLLASSENPLFIRKNITKEQALKLCVLVHSLRAEKKFKLLVLDGTEEMKEKWNEEGIENRFLKQPNPYSWKGDNDAWQEVFKSVGLTLATQEESIKEI